MKEFADLAIEKAQEAESKFGPYASLHEAYAVLLEEVDKLWEIVRQKQKMFGAYRSSSEIEKEALDIAADAERLATK